MASGSETSSLRKTQDGTEQDTTTILYDLEELQLLQQITLLILQNIGMAFDGMTSS